MIHIFKISNTVKKKKKIKSQVVCLPGYTVPGNQFFQEL